jgi:hypothetical protein
MRTLIVHHVANRGDEAKALHLNHLFRWSYPLPFLSLLAFVLMRQSIVPGKKDILFKQILTSLKLEATYSIFNFVLFFCSSLTLGLSDLADC